MSDVKKTLFEAACDAEVGTKWALTLSANQDVVVKKVGKVVWDRSEEHIPFHVYQRTDLFQLPSGPKKRDVDVSVLRLIGTLSVEVPDDAIDECVSAFDLIGRLMQWEGAQIGKPGWVMVKNNERWFAYRAANDIYAVTFETEEQCLAAHKSECPEMFNNSI